MTNISFSMRNHPIKGPHESHKQRKTCKYATKSDLVVGEKSMVDKRERKVTIM